MMDERYDYVVIGSGFGVSSPVFVGTSAGSINATLLAGTAELEPDDAAEKLLAFWRGLSVRDVYRSPLLSAPG